MIELQETLLFVTSCYTTYLKDVDRNKIIESVNSIKQTQKGNQLSNAGGYQSHSLKSPNYDCLETMKLFENLVIPIGKRISKEWGLPSDMNNVSYWYNINPKYSYNQEHNHPNCFLSGVFYLKIPTNSGKIFFLRSNTECDRMNFITSVLSNKGMNVDNNRINCEHWFVPYEGLLILFPSYLTHYVEQNLTDDLDSDRVSLAFNFS
jgi:hypothetical protein